MSDDSLAMTLATARLRQDGLMGAYCRARCPSWLVPETEFDTRLGEFLARHPLANER